MKDWRLYRRNRHTWPIRTDGGTARVEMTTRNFRLGMVLILGVALLMRMIYHLGTEPLVHIAGDINDYVRYAWNLGQHGVYSSAAISDATPVPDTFRPPGYPLFLLLAMQLADFGPAWFQWAQALQIVLSSVTVLLTMLLGREWLKPGFALAAGLFLAFWPHHIVFASTLLSETVYGLFVVLALWLTAVAWRKHSIWLAIGAGLVYGYAALINTLIVIFPLIVIALMLLKKRPRLALVLGSGFMVVSAAWWVASPPANEGTGSSAYRAQINLVQGSWPHYHAAWQARNHHESARHVMNMIDRETSLLAESPKDALRVIAIRMTQDPGSYATWYLLEKPYLLWGWDIQLGWGGFHFLAVRSTPFDRQPAFKATAAFLKLVNPILFGLAALAAAFYSIGWLPRINVPFAAVLVATFVLYVTFLHTILQAEPRYSIPYRPEQLLLAMGAISLLTSGFKQIITGTPQNAESESPGIQ